MQQEPKSRRERAADLIRLLVPDQRPTLQQVLWTIRIVLVIVVLLGILTLVGLPFNVTLWNWLDLLIIPIVLALGGYLFTRSENDRALRTAQKQRELDRALAGERAQDEALQAYLDQMSQLLVDKERPLHNPQVGDSVRAVAQARTLTLLSRLDGQRKGLVVKFLHESGMIKKDNSVLDLGADADLSGAILRGANLKEVGLRGALKESNIDFGLDRGVSLRLNRLLSLDGADFRLADLRGADLRLTNLRGASLGFAELGHVDLRGADLTDALGITNEELEDTAASLEGATLPDGQTYENWIEDRESNEENE